MRSYKFARRSFLAGIGGAFGLHILLRNLEKAAALGTVSPARLFMVHWPVGTVHYQFKPTGTQNDFKFSPILLPFETAGLKDDLSIFYGLDLHGLDPAGGGGHEAGTPMTTTGISCPGTRRNGGEADDACAGGPSWDQILAKRAPELGSKGSVQVICDSRVDSLETSTQCLSYSYDKQEIIAERPVSGGKITEHVPLRPQLSPLQSYLGLFSGFMPGGDTPQNAESLTRALKARKSVLDFSMRELAELRRLAPSSELTKIDAHTNAIREVEKQISDELNGGTKGVACVAPTAPPANLRGGSGSFDGGIISASESDAETHEKIGKLHASIILAAFKCDLTRVASFQWSPGTNHVSFKGLAPDAPNDILSHHPVSHRVGDRRSLVESMPTDAEQAKWVRYLINVHRWYNEKTAQIIKEFKDTTDAFGNSILDYTVVPMITEVSEATHTRSPVPALILGGKALGMKHGQYFNFEKKTRHINDFWLTVAQPFFTSNDPLKSLTADNFFKDGVSPVAGTWGI
jgi:hypothetical protein